ncbi:hypothetical protein LHP98_10240 [Rhodobacter sp. Har01]|uniref:hypothetical protein n=1 Tax=Rhodobacter sp. Har01 TaxID=2883999 RepID=UPI001D074752|nr:hypothetical protein [Rhodobacter sp. Har01]MCB6178510.1 hypothetical protein [Rhodobacter sp. Har01]
MFKRIVLVLQVLALTACSEKDFLQYQGRPAQTALECKAAYEAAKDRSASAGNYSSGASALGTLIGKSMVRGMTESHYNACLARVAALQPGTSTGMAAPSASEPMSGSAAAPRPVQSGGCSAGGGVMQGGTGYCFGN